MTHRDDLQCDVVSAAYDFGTKLGRLWMVEGDCCDMDGCIAFFKSIDPHVNRIETYSGNTADTVYMLRSSEWQALF